ncbi:uncharacterized protein METZ01_LOCUS145187, partial [marine metagenome]
MFAPWALLNYGMCGPELMVDVSLLGDAQRC